MPKKHTIIIHCLATKPGWFEGRTADEMMAEVRRWHVEERGWSAEGYASLLAYDGSRAAGRDLDGDGDTFEEIGAHTKGHNTGSIGIALQGGYGASANDAFSDHFTPEQDRALRDEIARIKAWAHARGDTITRVAGHNEFAAKGCPGFDVQRWLKGKKPRIEKITESRDAQIGGGLTLTGLISAVGSLIGGLNEWVQGAAVLLLIGAGIYLVLQGRRKFISGGR